MKYMSLGVQAMKKKNYKRAASHFQKAKRLNPKNIAAGKYLNAARAKMK